MSYAHKQVVTLTTDAGGDATGYTSAVNGKISAIVYTADGTNPFDATADFTITTETTGQAVLTRTNVTASFDNYPRAPAITAAGAASTLTEVEVPVVDERVQIVVAQGGNVTTGVITVILT